MTLSATMARQGSSHKYGPWPGNSSMSYCFFNGDLLSYVTNYQRVSYLVLLVTSPLYYCFFQPLRASLSGSYIPTYKLNYHLVI